MTQLSDKESALIEQAQWERDHQALPTDWEDAAPLGAESAFPATVLGWHHPDAHPAAVDDHWAGVVAMIAAERAAGDAHRARQRRIRLALGGGIMLIAGIAGLLLLMR